MAKKRVKKPTALDVALKKTLDVLKRLCLENPVLVSGLSLGPVVAISQSLKAGVSLSVAFAIIIIPVLVFFAFVPLKFSKSVRIVLCTLLSCLCFIPAFWFAKNIFPEVSDKVGVFLPLMVVNPIITSHSGEAVRTKKPLTTFIDGIYTTIGFSLVMCLISAIREILGKGTIWDSAVIAVKGNISFMLPFMGFIIIGFFAAGVAKINTIIRAKNEEVKK